MTDIPPFLHDDLADTPAPPSTGVRVLAVLGGVALVLVALLFTGGFALASFAGMGVAALIWHSRGRPYTRLAGWGGAVGAAALALVALTMFGLASVPRGAIQQIQQQAAVAAERPRQPDAVQRAIERMYPGSSALSKAQTQAIGTSMANSPTFFWSVLAFGGAVGAVGAGVFGAFVGSVAWGSATVLLFGVRGRWPATSRPSRPETFRDFHDAFDEIR